VDGGEGEIEGWMDGVVESGFLRRLGPKEKGFWSGSCYCLSHVIKYRQPEAIMQHIYDSVLVIVSMNRITLREVVMSPIDRMIGCG